MSRNYIATPSLVVLFAVVAAFGQGFWTSKAFPDWTDEEARTMTTNSPWAKDVTVTTGSRASNERDTTEIGVTELEAASRANASKEQTIKLNISWLTSLPIKQAMLKDRFAQGGDLAANAQQIMAAQEEVYAIGLSGLPTDMVDDVIHNIEQVKQSSLNPAKKPTIVLVDLDFQPRGRTTDVLFLFPRTNPISVEDTEVEVILKLGTFEARKKFNLKDMVYKGKLEL